MHYRVRYSLDFDLKIRSGQVCVVNVQIFVYNCVFLKQEKQPLVLITYCSLKDADMNSKILDNFSFDLI